MGTDSTGRDIFARMIHGGQISLIVGFLAVVFSVSLGNSHWRLCSLLWRLGGYSFDALHRSHAFHSILVPADRAWVNIFGKDVQTITVFGQSYSGSVGIVIIVIGVTSWMYLARIVRANVLSLRELDYISASKSLGASDMRIFFRHLVPNTMGAIIVSSTLGLAGAILSEAYVSFLGLGVQPPTASWGNMLTSAQSFIQRGAWWMWVFPSLFHHHNDPVYQPDR